MAEPTVEQLKSEARVRYGSEQNFMRQVASRPSVLFSEPFARIDGNTVSKSRSGGLEKYVSAGLTGRDRFAKTMKPVTFADIFTDSFKKGLQSDFLSDFQNEVKYTVDLLAGRTTAEKVEQSTAGMEMDAGQRLFDIARSFRGLSRGKDKLGSSSILG